MGKLKVLRRYGFSILYTIVLCGLNFYHYRVEKFLFSLTGEKFLIYLITALFVSFSVILLFKTIRSKKNPELALVLLTMGLIFFFFISRSPFLAKMNIAEFFILGILISLENKKSKSIMPFVLLIGAAFLVEIVINFSTGGSFYYLDVYMNSLTGLCGYIAGFLLI